MVIWSFPFPSAEKPLECCEAKKFLGYGFATFLAQNKEVEEFRMMALHGFGSKGTF